MTFWPTRGDVSPVPCTSAMVFSTGVPGGGVPPAPGVGVPALKSAALSAVLVLVALRETEVALEVPAAAPEPAQSLAEPQPTKSTTWGRFEQEPAPLAGAQTVDVSSVWVLTRATLPVLPLIAIEPLTSGVIPGSVRSVPYASPTRR